MKAKPKNNSLAWSKLDWYSLAAIQLLFLTMAKRFWFITDDAYISYRFSRHLAAGNGLRFNLGDHVPVEGYSNFLWVLVCALFEALGLDIELWPLLTSTSCGAILTFLVYRTLRLRFRVDVISAALATALFAAYPPVAVWATGGLATMPFALLLFVTFERFVLRRGGIHAPTAALSALGLALIRVEGIYWVVAILGLSFLSRLYKRERFAWDLFVGFVPVVMGYGAFMAWRFAYYGQLAANTVTAKFNVDLLRLERGFDYVASNFLTYLVGFLVLPATLCLVQKERRAIGLPTLAMALAIYAFAILVTGDYMTMGRFLVAGWAFTALLAGWLLHDLALRGSRGTATALGVATIVIGALPAWNVHLVPESIRARFQFRHNSNVYRSEYDQWIFQSANAQSWAATGRALKFWSSPGDVLVTGTIGAKGYYSELFILDRSGLVTPEVAKVETKQDRLRSPGHDKTVSIFYFLKFQPEIMGPKLAFLDGPGGVKNLAGPRRTEQLKKLGNLGNLYVVDFRPLPDWEYGGPGQYLVAWWRMEDEQAASRAAEKVAERLARLLDGEADPKKAALRNGYPRPPWLTAEE